MLDLKLGAEDLKLIWGALVSPLPYRGSVLEGFPPPGSTAWVLLSTQSPVETDSVLPCLNDMVMTLHLELASTPSL